MEKPGEILKDTNFYPEARKFREGLEVKNIANRKQVNQIFVRVTTQWRLIYKSHYRESMNQ